MSQGDSDSSSEVVEVESILAKRYNRQLACTEYLIKWATYDLYESTWEPENALKENADEALGDFETICTLRARGELAEFDIADFEEKQALYQEAQSVSSSGSSVQLVDAASRPLAIITAEQIESDSDESDRPLKQTTARTHCPSEKLSDDEDNISLRETTSIIKSSSRPLKILPQQEPAKPTYPTQFHRPVLHSIATSVPVQQHRKPTALSKELSKIRSSLVAKARSEAHVISAVRARKALSPEATRLSISDSAALKRKWSDTGLKQAQVRERDQRAALEQPGIGDDLVYGQQSVAIPQSPRSSSHGRQAINPEISASVPRRSLSSPGAARAATKSVSPSRSRMMHKEECGPASSTVNNASQQRQSSNSPMAKEQSAPIPGGSATSSAKSKQTHHQPRTQFEGSLAMSPHSTLPNFSREHTRSSSQRLGPLGVVRSQQLKPSQDSDDKHSSHRTQATANLEALPSLLEGTKPTSLRCPDLQLFCITDPDEGPVNFGRFQVMNLPPNSIFMEALAPFHAADPGAVYEMTTRSTFSTHVLVDALGREETQYCIAPLISIPDASTSMKKYCREGVFLFEDPNFVGLLVTEKSGALKAIQMLSKHRFDGMVAHRPTPYYFIFVTKLPVKMLPHNDVHRIGLMTEVGEQAHLHSMYQALGPHLAVLDQGGVVHLEGPRDHPDVLAVMTFLEKRLKLRSHSSMIESLEAATAQQQTLFVLLHRSVFAPPYSMSACQGLAQVKHDRAVQFIVFSEALSTMTVESSHDNLASIESERSTDERLYKCDIEGCSETYMTNVGLECHHQNYDHNLRDQRIDYRPHKCHQCDNRYKNTNDLKYHIKHQHPSAQPHQDALNAGWSPQTSFSALAFPAAITRPGSPPLQKKSACHIIVEYYAADLTSLRALVHLCGTSRFNWHIYISPTSLKTAGSLSYRQDYVAKETVRAAYGILGRKDDSDASFQPQSEAEASLLGQLVIEQWMQHDRIRVLDNVDYEVTNHAWRSPQTSGALSALQGAFSVAAWKQVRDFQTHRHTLVLTSYERSLEDCSKAEGVEVTTLVELAQSFARFQ